MNYIAFDTSDKILRILLVFQGETFSHTGEEGFTHSERLMPALDALLRGAGARVADLDAAGCVIGPGSFTGIRIGAATAKGLAAGGGLKLLAVNSAVLQKAHGGKLRSAFDAEIAAGEFLPPEELRPVYLMNSQAEGPFETREVLLSEADVIRAAELERRYFERPQTEEMLRARTAGNGRAAGIFDNGFLCAYYTALAGGDACELETLAVARAYRRLGFAEKLLDGLFAYAKAANCAEVRLEARSRNEAALGLYLKRGFKRAGLRKKYYPDGGDAVLLSRSVK